jgi:hypothetical protein
MTQRREATGQRATDLAGADDANLHCSTWHIRQNLLFRFS